MGTTNDTRRLVEADRELSEHFTSAVAGAKAQRYEPTTTGGDASPEEVIMSPWRSKARARHRAVEAMLADVSTETRRILHLVYAHGTDALSDATDDDGKPMAGKPSGLVAGKNNAPDPLGLLRVALSPSWGHGSFLRLAAGQHRALRAFAKRHPGTEPTWHAVLDHLAYEAGRGDASAAMLAELRNECEEARDGALRAFDLVRSSHLAAAAKARQEANAAERRRADEVLAKAQAMLRARPARKLPASLVWTDEHRKAAVEHLASLDVDSEAAS